MSEQTIETQPVPPEIAQAQDALAAVLVGDPQDLEVRLSVAEALIALGEVSPPYPPLVYPADGLPVDVGVPAAVAALDRAAEGADGVADTLRPALVARMLRELSVEPA